MSDQADLFGKATGADDPVRTLEGVVDRVVFASDETGYSVLRVTTGGEKITAVGTFPGVNAGEAFRLTGHWVEHPKFGRQFEVESVLPVTPSTLDGVRRYLGSGLVPGIGEAFATRLVAHFGDATLDVIEQHPERLSEVAGIGPKRIAKIRKAWGQHRAARDVMVFLQSHGISPAYAGRIHKRYGAKALAVLRENPYRLAADVAGIGFKRADEIARSCGIALDSPLRARAGLLHVLQSEADSGHTRTPRHDLVGRGSRELDIEPGLLETACDELLAGNRLVARDDQLMLTALYDAELSAARSMAALIVRARSGRPPGAQEIEAAEGRCGLRLESAQHTAVVSAAAAPLSILTGGPGTGKTTCLRVLLDILSRRGERLALAAPTGRAAKRMAEATGRQASTLHRLLGYSPRDGCFHRDAETPLQTDVVVVDEVSMVDVMLLQALLAAIAPPTRLLLVGDADQLPSVGPGQVLSDLIRSGRIEVQRLSVIFRQQETSGIVRAAHQVLGGDWPTSGTSPDDDFFYVRREEAQEAAELIVELVSRRIPGRFRLDPFRDVQVLTPMHRGACGAQALNDALREAINPPRGPRHEVMRGARIYRRRDRVMQIRNDYDREVFNGDLGQITAIDHDEGEVTVHVDGRAVVYGFDELDALVPAYAVSIHKSQGSEYPAVVIPVLGEHWVMLQRNLLYTGLTRGKQLVTLVGSNRALGRCISNGDTLRRRTLLRRLLIEELGALVGKVDCLRH